VRRAGGTHYHSLERNPEFAAVIMALVSLAGRDDVVRVHVGSSDASIQRLHAAGHLRHIDLLFLDHYKPAYTTDLKLCEDLGLVGPGSVFAADNVVKPGNPPYLEYVRSSVAEKRARASEGRLRPSDVDAFGDRHAKQYAKRVASEKLEAVVGNPNLVYESRLVESFEPTGVPDAVEVTRCVGEEK
jgi:catechol O-methyltransferase